MSEDGEPSLPSHRGHVIYVKAQVRAFSRSIAVGKSNIVQTANAIRPASMTLFPTRADWDLARKAAALQSSAHDDMHAGELEVSILAAVWPDAVRPGALSADHLAQDRAMFLVHGMAHYTKSGVIGEPSAGTATKGSAILDSLVGSFADHLKALGLSGFGKTTAV